MTQYLLDTNVLLRAADIASPTYLLANNVILQITESNDECVIIPQVLTEFWVVATRPLDVNGLGWTTTETVNYINDLLDNFRLIEETPDIFPLWLQLVSVHHIKGKRTHDIRILSMMIVHQIPYLLTFNPDDFISLPNISIIHPQDL